MKKIILSLLSVASFELSTAAMAEDSPYSPAFVLGEQQVISHTAVSVGRVDYQPYARVGSVSFGHSDAVIGYFASQTLRLGLAGDTEIGVSDTFSDLESTKFRGIRTVDGFSNPTIHGRKTWWADGAVRVSLHGGVTPKLGGSSLRDFSTSYGVGLTAAMIAENGLVTSLDVTRFMHEGNNADSTAVTAGAYREFGLYGLTVSGTLQNFNNGPSTRYIYPELRESIYVGVSRQVAEKAWAQVSYQYAHTTYQEHDFVPLVFRGFNIEGQYLGASLSVMF